MPIKKNIFNNPKLKRPVIFAHRGSSAYAPENTLAAFRLAIQQHAEAIELDAKLCADGQVIVIHDESVNRTTDGTGLISSLSLAEIKALDAGIKFSPAFQAEKIPTLAEVFEAVGNQIFIDIELKNYMSPTDDLPDRVVSLVKKYGLESSVMLSSFNLLALIRARYLLPRIPLGIIAIAGDAPKILLSKVIRLGALTALHPATSDTSPELVQAAHRVGSLVHAYTANTPDVMQQLITAGVDGIFTYDPPLAQKVLAETSRKEP